MTKMLDLIHMMQRGEIAPPPVAALIGFTLASVEPGCAVVEFEATPRDAGSENEVERRQRAGIERGCRQD